MSNFSVSYSTSSILNVAMLHRSSLILILVLLTNLINPSSSSAVIKSDNCLNSRSKFFLSLSEYIYEKNIRLDGQEIELAQILNEIAALEDQIKTYPAEINAKVGYSSSASGFGDPDPIRSKDSEISVSLSVPISAEKRLTDVKIKKSLQKSLEYRNLLLLRQHSAALSHLLTIFNLETLHFNALKKLPIVFDQIEYYKLRQKIGAYNVRELSRAEMSKLKIENEIINLKARIDVELSELISPERLYFDNLPDIPKLQNIYPKSPEYDCGFHDPEVILKKLETEIKDIELKIARSSATPSANIAIGIASKDYHSGSHANNYSIGLAVSGPLYSGGKIEARIKNAERKLQLAEKDLATHKEKFEKKRVNFLLLESSLLRSIEQARRQIVANDSEIKELIERKNAGFSVFEDLSERKLQRVELNGILFDLSNRLASFWVSYLENISE